jgi:hypothetical protein
MIKPETLIEALRTTDNYIEKIYLNGGCYQFYKFLKAVYPEAKPYTDEHKLHVVTRIGEKLYDIRGIVEGIYYPLSKEDEKACEQWSFSERNWLYKECPNCSEYISA